MTALSPKSGQVWPSSVSQSPITKSSRGASGPANSVQDLLCRPETSWPTARSFSSTSGIGAAAGASPPNRRGIVAAEAVEDRLGHDRARRIAGAQKQHVEGRRHRLALLGNRRQQAREIAAQLRPAAAAGLGQEGEQLAQSGDPHRVDDLPALPGRADQPRPFKAAARWKDVVEAGISQRRREISRAGNPLGPQPISRRRTSQPAFLAERAKNRGGFH